MKVRRMLSVCVCRCYTCKRQPRTARPRFFTCHSTVNGEMKFGKGCICAGLHAMQANMASLSQANKHVPAQHVNLLLSEETLHSGVFVRERLGGRVCMCAGDDGLRVGGRAKVWLSAERLQSLWVSDRCDHLVYCTREHLAPLISAQLTVTPSPAAARA